MKSWININEDSDFSIHNIPFGIFSVNGSGVRMGTAIGDKVLDLRKANELGIFDGIDVPAEVFDNQFINDFMSLGKKYTNAVREQIQAELCNESSVLRNNPNSFYEQSRVTMHMPVDVRYYNDY
jgi:fumarylacetoacetase